MDDITKHRLLKTGKISLHGADTEEEVHARVREAAEILGVTGRGSRSWRDSVAGRMTYLDFIPFGWDGSETEPDETVVKCIGYTLVGYEVFREENVVLLYLDSPLDSVGEPRRIEIRDGAVVEICRSDLLYEGDVVGQVGDVAVASHPLSRVLGSTLRWFVRYDEEAFFGFGQHMFQAITGEVHREGVEHLRTWIQYFEERQRDRVPVVLGYDQTSPSSW